MKSRVTLNTDLLNQDDICNINHKTSNHDIEFDLLETNDFAPSGAILILIEIAQNVGYNAVYDILKYCLLNLTSTISEKINQTDYPRKTEMKISINGMKFALSCNFPLSESQQEALVAAAIQKLEELEVNV